MIKTIVSIALPVGERLLIRKHVISHGKGTKRICIVTGTHGDELEGQYVCFRLNKMVQENIDKLDGTLEIYPALNPLGIDSITRGIPGFDLDMNRIFPGNPEGTMAERAAYDIFRDLRGADMVIDIHSSNIFLREIPQVRVNINTAERLVPYARLLNTDFIWIHEAATVLESTLAHSLNSTDTPTLVVEMGVGMRINHGYGNRLVTGILNLMHEMGMWSEKPEPHLIASPVVSVADNVSFINAEASGIFLTEIRNNIIVDEGKEIGSVVSPLTGEVLQQVSAPVHGLLFTLRAYPVVYEGSLLARIHRLN
ncbi:M14 family metallopeptidase [Bacteroides sp. An51A]|uniref:M14 family metallopeptidase n=1 Tax=Bacteroides sp. An51A TaxID=1965640 RepID=UPI000B3A50C3|nr:M14 family metallopeptidase [Bacteroides sp. An51A]OUN82226.1 succinylglutamate desuccinylase [Bacteroides sp. An51A]